MQHSEHVLFRLTLLHRFFCRYHFGRLSVPYNEWINGVPWEPVLDSIWKVIKKPHFLLQFLRVVPFISLKNWLVWSQFKLYMLIYFSFKHPIQTPEYWLSVFSLHVSVPSLVCDADSWHLLLLGSGLLQLFHCLYFFIFLFVIETTGMSEWCKAKTFHIFMWTRHERMDLLSSPIRNFLTLFNMTCNERVRIC